jgi:hypothetical protein
MNLLQNPVVEKRSQSFYVQLKFFESVELNWLRLLFVVHLATDWSILQGFSSLVQDVSQMAHS